MMAVIQISHLSLITLPVLNPCFKALSNIWFINGLNYFLFSSPKSHMKNPNIPNQIKGLALNSLFVQNYNLSLLLIFSPYIFSIVLYVVSKTCCQNNQKKKDYLQILAKISSCEYAFCWIMFSGYIIAVAWALECIFGINNTTNLMGVMSIIQSVLLLIIVIIYFIFLIKVPQFFGEFIDLFN